MRDPQLSIGILACNEELRIGNALRTIFEQDVFEKISTEVVIVPNGCVDETAAVARRLIQDYQGVWSTSGSARVHEVAEAGKANAWNRFVRELSSPVATMLVLMDADVTLFDRNTISSLVETLESNSQAVICADRPVKDIQINERRTLFQRLLSAATPDIDPENVPLCGQLYCALSAQLRLIKLPLQITCEDGFLRALLLTNGFTKPEDRRRIVLDPRVAHHFAAVASLRELFRHEAWVVAGSIVNMLLFELFSVECSADRSAMILMKAWDEQTPEWLQLYIKKKVREKGWHLLPRSWWTRRWTRLRRLSWGQRLRRLPVAAIAAAMDVLIFVFAIRDVRSGRAFGYWRG